jgi:dihydropteroate synthase
MKSRALFLSSDSRIAEIKIKYGCEIPRFLLNGFLFELSGLSSIQLSLLKRLNHSITVFNTNNHDIKLISLKDNIDFGETLAADDELRKFFKKLDAFFTDSQDSGRKFFKLFPDYELKPVVMGILNVTPDSFYDGAKYNRIDKALEQAFKMIDAGAGIIDVGGESTRPGAEQVSAEEELGRVIPVIKELRRQSNIPISIDTYKSRVAREALAAGANIVNDISGGNFDPQMIPLVKEAKCLYAAMHIKGTPKNMQHNPEYDDVLEEVYRFFEKKLQYLADQGVSNVVIDPGIGFGKRLQDNLRLIRDLKDFTFLNYPILVGASRKSMIGEVLNADKDERLWGSLSVHLRAALNGASIIRTHDVKETAELLKMSEAVDRPV